MFLKKQPMHGLTCYELDRLLISQIQKNCSAEEIAQVMDLKNAFYYPVS